MLCRAHLNAILPAVQFRAPLQLLSPSLLCH